MAPRVESWKRLGFWRVSKTQKRSIYETSEETYELMTHLPVYGRFGFRSHSPPI